jgi:hypothetical protein
MLEDDMDEDALTRPCGDCGGSGKWFDMPPAKRRIGYGEKGPSECTTCGGWGLVPTAAGRPVFDMIVAMRASPKWR